MMYPEHDQSWKVDDAYMMGDTLLIAPVTQLAAVSREINLPPGDWYNFWTDQKYTGNTIVSVDAPLDRLPILVRSGACLPMGPKMPFIPADHQFSELTFHFYPPFDGTFTFRDDDGLTRSYQQGRYSEFLLAWHTQNHQIDLDMTPESGTFVNQPSKRRYTLVFHSVIRASEITCSLPGEVKVDPHKQIVSISFEKDASQLAHIQFRHYP